MDDNKYVSLELIMVLRVNCYLLSFLLSEVVIGSSSKGILEYSLYIYFVKEKIIKKFFVYESIFY